MRFEWFWIKFTLRRNLICDFVHGVINKVTSLVKGLLGALKGLLIPVLIILGIALFFYLGFH